MNKDIFDIKDIKDFFRLVIFLVVSPFIGMVMLLGLISTSIAMICMFLKDFIMEKFYE
jgi:hypothetical protein